MTTEEIRALVQVAVDDPRCAISHKPYLTPVRQIITDVTGFLGEDVDWTAASFRETASAWLDERTDLKDATRASYWRWIIDFVRFLEVAEEEVPA